MSITKNGTIKLLDSRIDAISSYNHVFASFGNFDQKCPHERCTGTDIDALRIRQLRHLEH
jgi:hypothetical protein